MSEHDLRMEIVSLRQQLDKAEANDRDVVSAQQYAVLDGEAERLRRALKDVARYVDAERGAVHWTVILGTVRQALAKRP